MVELKGKEKRKLCEGYNIFFGILGSVGIYGGFYGMGKVVLYYLVF